MQLRIISLISISGDNIMFKKGRFLPNFVRIMWRKTVNNKSRLWYIWVEDVNNFGLFY